MYDKEAGVSMKEIRFKLAGAKSLYPNKHILADELSAGSVPVVKLKNNGEKIVAYFNGGLCGYVDPKGYSEETTTPYEEIVQAVKDQEIEAKIINKIGLSFIGSFTTTNKSNEVANVLPQKLQGALKEVIDDIVTKGILSRDEIDERVDYLKKNNVTEKQMISLFKTYRRYNKEVEKL